jgi:hypothetical protein
MMSQEGGARAVEKLIQTFGCLPSAPDGPIIARFDPRALAAAIECEMQRGAEYGWSKITLHMDMPDALMLAKYLRK